MKKKMKKMKKIKLSILNYVLLSLLLSEIIVLSGITLAIKIMEV